MAGARKSPEETLAALQKKKEQVDAQIKTTAAKVRSAERKKDTRRKIILGGAVMAHMDHNAAFKVEILKLISEHVTRPEDRVLFNHIIP